MKKRKEKHKIYNLQQGIFAQVNTKETRTEIKLTRTEACQKQGSWHELEMIQ